MRVERRENGLEGDDVFGIRHQPFRPSAAFRRGCCILGFGARETIQAKVRNLGMTCQ